MIESIITGSGQTTLPDSVREALSVQAGGRVRYVILDGEVRMIGMRPISRLYGTLKREGAPVTLENMERAIIDGARGHDRH